MDGFGIFAIVCGAVAVIWIAFSLIVPLNRR